MLPLSPDALRLGSYAWEPLWLDREGGWRRGALNSLIIAPSNDTCSPCAPCVTPSEKRQSYRAISWHYCGSCESWWSRVLRLRISAYVLAPSLSSRSTTLLASLLMCEGMIVKGRSYEVCRRERGPVRHQLGMFFSWSEPWITLVAREMIICESPSTIRCYKLRLWDSWRPFYESPELSWVVCVIPQKAYFKALDFPCVVSNDYSIALLFYITLGFSIKV